jgi:hypothetical protein
MRFGPTLMPKASWEWLRKRLVLCALTYRTPEWNRFLQTVRTFGSIGLIKSCLFVIWSKWDYLYGEMQRLIREELSAIDAVEHRTDLIQRMDYILSQPKAWISRVYEGD